MELSPNSEAFSGLGSGMNRGGGRRLSQEALPEIDMGAQDGQARAHILAPFVVVGRRGQHRMGKVCRTPQCAGGISASVEQ